MNGSSLSEHMRREAISVIYAVGASARVATIDGVCAFSATSIQEFQACSLTSRNLTFGQSFLAVSSFSLSRCPNARAKASCCAAGPGNLRLRIQLLSSISILS
jgi:hypothetical protein